MEFNSPAIFKNIQKRSQPHLDHLMSTNRISTRAYRSGCVNGRFQPPHKGHLEYILEAKKQCDFLWVGITRFDLFDDTPCDKATHRANCVSNPLTYFERVKILTAVLTEQSVPPSEFAFLPFPIDRPSRLPQFLPLEIPIFTTVYDDWNRHKVKVLQEAGYKVNVLWERTNKQYEGHTVRDLIKANSIEWEAMVPRSAVSLLKEINLKSRL